MIPFRVGKPDDLPRSRATVTHFTHNFLHIHLDKIVGKQEFFAMIFIITSNVKKQVKACAYGIKI